jgi:putative flavoprotein involved in K+ transport
LHAGRCAGTHLHLELPAGTVWPDMKTALGPRVEGVVDGKPKLADGRVLEVASVVWATGFKPDFGWVELPILGQDGYPLQHRGVVTSAPGLYFIGLPFQHTFASAVIGGVGKDARYIAEHIAEQPTELSVSRDRVRQLQHDGERRLTRPGVGP